MSKHILEKTHLDDERVVWLRPDPDPKQDPGWRFRLDKEKGEIAFLSMEQVLPEKVDSPNARHTFAHKSMSLSKDEVRWLRDSLTELLELDW